MLVYPPNGFSTNIFLSSLLIHFFNKSTCVKGGAVIRVKSKDSDNEESSIKKECFEAYGISKGTIDDPNKKSILALFEELHNLHLKVKSLESKLSDSENKKEQFQLKLKKEKTIKFKEK